MYLKNELTYFSNYKKKFKGTKKEATNLQLFVCQLSDVLLKSNKTCIDFWQTPSFFRSCYVWSEGEKNAEVSLKNS